VKTGPVLEIIEIIDDDDAETVGAGGPRQVDSHSVPDGGRRWVGAAAATALLVVIGYGVISSAISNGASTSPQPATTLPLRLPRSLPLPTNRNLAGTVPAPKLVSPQFFIADPAPVGFSMHFAETLGMGGNPADFADTATAQLWATDGARADHGSWFVVSRGTHHSTGRNAYRTAVGGTEVVVERDPTTGQSRLSFSKNGDDLEITAYGWADRQLLRLVDSVFVSDSQIQFHNAFFVTDHKQLLDADPATAIYGLPVSWVGYTNALPAPLRASFTITVAGFPLSNRDVAVRFALLDPHPIAVGEVPGIVGPGVIGRSAADPTVTIIQWRDGERLITIRGDIDQDVLLSIAGTVHATPDHDLTQQVRPDPPTTPAPIGDQHRMGSGWLDGWWTVHVSVTPGDPTQFMWWIAQPLATGASAESRLSLPGSGPSIETFVEHGRTYVVAKVPRSMAGASLHVNLNGLPSAQLFMIDADAALDAEFAAYAFTEPVPYTAQIVDANGQTVASWPTT
jgi:hypothetical protein